MSTIVSPVVLLYCLEASAQSGTADASTSADLSTGTPPTSPHWIPNLSAASSSQDVDGGPVQIPYKEMESDWEYLAPAPTAKKSSGHVWKGFRDSHACPEPGPTASDQGFEAYERFMNRALSLPPKNDEVLVVRISPSFHPDRTLSVVRNSDGSYRLRSRRLVQHVWAEMMGRMQQEQGAVVRLDKSHQTSALSGLHTAKSVKERSVDSRTANLMLRLWAALAGRAQRVREIGMHTVTLDGTYYRIWQGERWIITHSPRPGSVLALAVEVADRLEYLVAEGAIDEDSLLEETRFEMTNALQRTRRKEPCLEAVNGWSN